MLVEHYLCPSSALKCVVCSVTPQHPHFIEIGSRSSANDSGKLRCREVSKSTLCETRRGASQNARAAASWSCWLQAFQFDAVAVNVG
jgi:hypothetical protein